MSRKNPILPKDRRWLSVSKDHLKWLREEGHFKRNVRSMDDIIGELIDFFKANGGAMP